MNEQDKKAFEAAFMRTFAYPDKADQTTFKQGWQAALQYARGQQEPYIWVSESVEEKQLIKGKPRRLLFECVDGVGFPLYTTPPAQPVQPAFAHVKETPKNEHDSGDVLKPAKQELCPSCRKADIYACTCPFKTERNSQPECFEPTKLVRLTKQKPVAFYYRSGLVRAGHGIEIKDGTALYAESMGLIRLTDEEIAHEYSKADAYLMLCDEYEFGLVANAIMDAMIKKNGGSQ